MVALTVKHRRWLLARLDAYLHACVDPEDGLNDLEGEKSWLRSTTQQFSRKFRIPEEARWLYKAVCRSHFWPVDVY